jgi:acyl-CoA thioester hydrolase
MRAHFPGEMSTETVMVYFEDLDAMGVVHSGRYVILLERALAAYGTRAGWTYDPGHPRFAEVFFVVREFTIAYHAPISRAGTVRVQLWLDHLGTTSVVYGFRVLSDDGTVVHAEGRRVQVRLDPATLQPAPIGSELREACRTLLAREQTDARQAA